MGNFLQSILASPPVMRTMNYLLGHYVTIYMIHRPQPDNHAYEGLTQHLLDECLGYAKAAGFEFAYIDDLVADALAGKKRQRPTMCFTLDDGYQDQVDELVPVLLRHDAKPTLYTIVDMLDRIDWPWDAKLNYAVWNSTRSHPDFCFNERRFQLDLTTAAARTHSRRQLTRMGKTLSVKDLNDFVRAALAALAMELPLIAPPEYQPAAWESLRAAERQGLRIGSHACSHHVFAALSDTDVSDELQRANRRLAQEINNPSQVFCYPSGTRNDFFPRHTQLVQAEGFIGALTAMPGNIHLRYIQKNPFAIKRHSFPNSFDKFVRYSSWLEYIRSSIEQV
jgi:peptidoglycan/xylan/chitin deacetylase (PgdA/CDA1 family)